MEQNAIDLEREKVEHAAEMERREIMRQEKERFAREEIERKKVKKNNLRL